VNTPILPPRLANDSMVSVARRALTIRSCCRTFSGPWSRLLLVHLTLVSCYDQIIAKRMPPEVLEYLRSMGKAFGKLGGKTAAKNMTDAERKACGSPSPRSVGIATDPEKHLILPQLSNSPWTVGNVDLTHAQRLQPGSFELVPPQS